MSATTQNLFDRVVTHLFTQGRPAVRADGMCRFWTTDLRTGQVLQCAIGCLIGDREVCDDLETKGNILAYHSPVLRAVATSLNIPLNQIERMGPFLYFLQQAHDGAKVGPDGHWADQGEDLASRLSYIASQFHLSTASMPLALAEHRKRRKDGS